MFGAEPLPKIPTGTDIVVASNNMMTTTGSGSSVSGVQPMSPMDTIREVFFEIRDSLQAIVANTLETNELLKVGVLGTPAEQRDEAIASGETDSQGNPPPADEGGPGFLDRLSNLNPFKGGLGTFGKFLVAIGALVGLQLFGDKLIPSIAKMLQTFKEGGVGDTIKDIYTTFKEKVVDVFENIKKGTIEFLKYAKQVYGFIEDIVKSVEAYIMQFDKDGDGKLDPDERDALATDIKDRAVNMISDFFGEVMLSLSGFLLSATFIGIASKAAYARLLPLFTSTATTGAAAAVGAPMAAGLGTALPIAGLILYGFSTTYTNISRALKKTLDENKGQFDTSDFFANFLGGGEGGGVMNAFKQAFLVGGSFALAGMAIGLPFGPLGVLAGGLIGTAVGLAVGAFTGYIGSGVLKEKFQGFADMIGDSVDSIKNFYNDIIAGFKSLFSGSSFMKGFSARGDADVEGLTEKVDAAEKYVKSIEEFQADNPKLAALPANVKLLEDAKADLAQLRAKLSAAPAKSKQYKLDDIEDELTSKTKKRDKLQAKVDKGNLMPGLDITSQGVPFETQIKQLNAEIESLKIQKEAVSSTQSLEELIEVQEPANFDNSQMIMDEYMKNKFESMGATNIVENPQGGGYMFANNNNQLSQNIKTETHSHAGLSSGDNFYTAVVAANKLGKMQTTN